MEILYTNCAGLDVHKKTVKVCVLTHASHGQTHKEFRTYLTTTEELLKLGDEPNVSELRRSWQVTHLVQNHER